MGLLADLANCSINFTNPKQGAAFGAITNLFICVMHAFDMEFGITFDPDPKKGVGGTFPAREWWDIGIIQNVVFEHIRFEYDDGSVFSEDFKDAVLDTVSSSHKPFYADPVIVPGCQLDPMLPCARFIKVMEPVLEVAVTAKGYGELLDPWDSTGVAVANKPDSVTMADEPSFGARKQLQNGAWIADAEHIMAFQTWLVAQSPTTTHVVASFGPFSLVFWMTAQASPGQLSIGAPPHQFTFYGEKGTARKVNRKTTPASPTFQVQSGNGGRKPVLSGQTANDRGRQWLRSKGLVP
jgi:hypothetical protein